MYTSIRFNKRLSMTTCRRHQMTYIHISLNTSKTKGKPREIYISNMFMLCKLMYLASHLCEFYSEELHSEFESTSHKEKNPLVKQTLFLWIRATVSRSRQLFCMLGVYLSQRFYDLCLCEVFEYCCYLLLLSLSLLTLLSLSLQTLFSLSLQTLLSLSLQTLLYFSVLRWMFFVIIFITHNNIV